MQVANNARAIEKYLKKRYEKAIEAVQTTAKQEADEISESYSQQAKKLENDIFVTAKNQAAAMKTQQISAAKTQARKDKEQALAQLSEEVCNILREKYMKSNDKNTYLTEIRERIVESIKKRDMNPEDFEFSEDKQELHVQAQTDELLIEDGLDIQLEEFKKTIIEHVKNEVAQ
jgi:exoribonuclease R